MKILFMALRKTIKGFYKTIINKNKIKGKKIFK